MSIYRRILGRELPCTLCDLLQVPLSLEGDPRHRMEDAPTITAQASYRIGLWHLNQSQGGLAHRWLGLALADCPQSAQYRLAFAAACEMLCLHRQAAEAIECASAAGEPAGLPVATLRCAAGFALERAGDPGAAIERYTAALLASPCDLFAHHRLSAIHLARGNGPEASIHLRAILWHQPADPIARACLGHLLQAEGRYSEAAWEYEQALCLEPDSWEMPPDLAQQLTQGDSPSHAIDVLEQLIAAQPQFPDLRMRLGNLYSLRGDDTAARRHFRKALAIHPDYLDCRIAMARHELRMGRPELAMEHFQRAIAINDQHVELYVGLALARRHAGQPRQAEEILDSAARITGNSAVLLAQLGILETDAEFPPEAAGELRLEWVAELLAHNQAMLDAHPTWTDVRLQQARFHQLLGQRAQAIAILRELAREEPDCPEAQLQIGLIHHEAQDGAASAEALESAIAPSPLSGLHYRLGLICCSDVEFDLAMEQLERASSRPADVQRRIWCEIEGMQLASEPPVVRRMRRPHAPVPEEI